LSRICHTLKLRYGSPFILSVLIASCGDTSTSPTTTTTTTTTSTVPAPTVTAVEPVTGSVDGGTEVVITGTDFTEVTTVLFGTNQTLQFAVNSDTTITATAPAGTLETADVVVTTTAGSSVASEASQFTWLPNILKSLVLSASSVTAGSAVTGTVTVTYPAPSVSIRLPVKWRSTPPDSTAILAPISVVVPAGATEGSFQITTFYSSTEEQIEVTSEHWGEARATFTLRP
jgi:hypothetical protein